ncbi:MAG: hypothetical protein IPK03_09180 [Bacteroidetes bacterium]|nr:hypothetical protein [Bacteroidota bacterium]
MENQLGGYRQRLDASNVLNTDHLFDEDGESYATQNSSITKLRIQYFYLPVYFEEFHQHYKIIEKKTLAFISKSVEKDNILLKMKQANYKELSQSKDPFNLLLKYGHFYNLKEFKDFYSTNKLKFPIRTIDDRKVDTITEMKMNGKQISINQLFSECAMGLKNIEGIWCIEKGLPLSSYDLLNSERPVASMIHIHPNLKGNLDVWYKGNQNIQYQIDGEDGPSSKSSLNPKERGDMQQVNDNTNSNVYNVVVDKFNVWLYNSNFKFKISLTSIV